MRSENYFIPIACTALAFVLGILVSTWFPLERQQRWPTNGLGTAICIDRLKQPIVPCINPDQVTTTVMAKP